MRGKRLKLHRIIACILVVAITFGCIQFDGLGTDIVAAENVVTFYFVDNTSEKWISNDNAGIELVDNTNGHVRYDMEKEDGVTWKVQVPESAYNITFNRYDESKSTQWNSWSAGGRDSKNTFYADGNEYGHWEYVEDTNEENYFHAGDILYLDLTGFTDWENDNALMHVNFTNASKVENDGKDIAIESADKNVYNPVTTDYEIEEHIYAYIVTKQDEGKDILRFWRGNTANLWNCSVSLDYKEYRNGNNCVNVNGWDLSGYISKKSYKINLESDKDNDRISDYLEAILGLDKSNSDTDGDGLSDYDEIVITKTDPLKYDSVKEGVSDAYIDLDNDGINNLDEISFSTNPRLSDTDEDGLTDYDEIYIYFTDPIVADTDSDKLNDGDEVALGLNPLVSDTDGNGIIDGEEYIEQTVNSNRFDNELYNENIAKPVALNVLARGNVNSNLEVSEYTGCLKGEDRSYIGKTIEISGSEINSGIISFELDDSYKIQNYELNGESTNGLLICYNDGENTFPLDTDYDETTRRLTAGISSGGIYFILDVIKWADSLGIDYKEFEINSLDASSYTAAKNSDTNIQIKGQTDIVFIIDTTGSMDSYISNVKNNINAFVDEITNAGITPYFALVDYKDITCDGQTSTNTKKNSDNSNWFKEADEFKNEIEKLSVSGGGDAPETVIDALEMARQLDLRQSSQKFFIVVTDAGYKINNNYGIGSMSEMIDLLKADKINVSVVSGSGNQSVYKSLYEETGGVFANVGGDFKTQLLAIAGMISNETNSGCWVALNGLVPQIVKLDEKPVVNGKCDTDGDALPDWKELDELKNFEVNTFFDKLSFRLNFMSKTIPIYDFTSNPVKPDTDDDGLLDGQPVYVEYTNSKGIVETLEAAPKDPDPKHENGPKNVWNKHITSMKEGNKLATEDSDDYYNPVKPEVNFEWNGILPDIDTNLIEYLNSLYASAESRLCDFRYDYEHTALHSYGFQWQVLGGYNDLYDVVFDIVCSMDKRKFKFEFEGKEYVIWAWKGSYLSLGPGSEVGFYETENDLGLWSFSDYFEMSCNLYHKIGDGSYRTLYNWYPEEYQWWVTGFVPDEILITKDKLVQVSSVKLPSDMYNEFKGTWENREEAKELVFDDIEERVWLTW